MRARIVPWSLIVLVVAVLGACNASGFSPFGQIEVKVTNPGGGNGQVVASDPNVQINCQFTAGASSPSPCEDTFPDAGGGGVFTLNATPAAGSTFGSWTGCSSSAGTVCTLTFAQSFDTTFVVQARFDLPILLGVNLLQDPGFEGTVAVGGLPTVTGQWRGDSVYTVGIDQGITPLLDSRMLRFIYGGPLPSTLISSQVWQLVDVSTLAAAIDSGKIQETARGLFNRVTGDVNTDTRFDLRVHAFPGTPAGFPTDYPSPTAMGDSVITSGNLWQPITVTGMLPLGTRYLAVEIYAYENIQNDLTDPEFDGHYADDLSLILTRLP
jgi:hypothetical protein